jgi:hypothetical protein
MFQLTAEESDSLKSQNVTLKVGRGQHRKYLPFAFPEQGVAMLSSVLRSKRAVQVNIEIMRAFVRLIFYPINGLNGAQRLNGWNDWNGCPQLYGPDPLEWAERDIKQNWSHYRERFLRGEWP